MKGRRIIVVALDTYGRLELYGKLDEATQDVQPFPNIVQIYELPYKYRHIKCMAMSKEHLMIYNEPNTHMCGLLYSVVMLGGV
jgi:hypothetical protein